ncbi:ATP-binding cassette domain-containing protein [Pedobacter sp. KBW06]|uniref:ABC transporter ATP-binding protein n=1 Tax=Pedobacter sp. KBW06 TaxID=2153359 RepID=UPI0013153742|nr:ATP-binding cassette domain-containing protein [Pedobacter sp. KBW06]
MISLDLEDIEKKYGAHTILSFEKWSLDSGIYWIKGGNGTGKTTLFRVISGQTPFKGALSLNQISLKKQPVAYRAMISYAEAEPQYPSFITGNELLKYIIALRKADRKVIEDIIEQFGMTAFMNNKIGSYSSGMLKKLSLICAFTGDIQLYILDEPLITIDAKSAQVLYGLINQYHKKGSSFLLSSHQELEPGQLALKATFQIKDRKIEAC